MFASPCPIVEPRSSVSRGGEDPRAAATGSDSTQRLLEAAAAANAAHQAAMTAAMAAAAAAGGRAHERRDGSCEEDGVDAEAEGAVDLSRSGFREASPEIDVGGGRNDDGDDAPLDLKVRPAMSSVSPRSCSPSPSGRRSRQRGQGVGLSALPGPEQRAELLRIAELYTSAAASSRGTPPPPATPTQSQQGDAIAPPSRDSSQDSSADVDSLCQFCGTDTTSAEYVPAEHRDGVCNRGTIACPMCAKTFTQFAQYEAHKKTHQKLKQRQYPCQTCGKIFTSASNRNMHQRIHKGVRPFQCTPCGVFFRQKAHLQKHQRTQGHVQATEIYEKKRREGLIPENATPQLPAVTTLPPPPPTSDDQESTSSERHIADSTQSASPPAADSSTDEKTPTSSSGGRSRSKSSPKRKQSRPQKNKEAGEEEEGSEEEVDGEEEKVLTFVEYNDVSHGYDCRQCLFASHDLSVLKHHAREEHLRGREGYVRCEECGIAFLKEFYLRIHGLTHRTASQVLPCENCEQVFKAPNRLMKHMESSHSICSDCGERAENSISLVRHQEITHGEKKGFHASLLQFTSLNQLSSPKSIVAAAAAEENRAAKKRKLDSLAEVIRQKQLQHQNSSTTNAVSATSITGQSTSALNGNEVKSPLTSPTTPRRRKTDLAAVRALLAMSKGSSSSLEPAPPMHHGSTDTSFMNQFDPSKLAPVGMQDLLRKSENNNILSSLKLPPAVRLPTQPVHGLTPPSSPPPAQLPCATQPPSLLLQQQHPIPPQTVSAATASNGGRYHSDNESDDQDQETGLDLSMGGRRLRRDSGDENGVSSTNNGPTDLSLAGRGPDSSTLMAARALASLPAPPPPPHLQQQAPAAFPSPFPFLLPPVPPGTDPVLTEQLLKLSAGLTRPASTGGHSPIPPHLTELTKNSPVASASNPYTVLSAMLGQPPYHQPVFPGMAPAGVFPSATSSPKCGGLEVAKENLPKLIVPPQVSKSERAPSATSTSSSGTKPFQCPFCAKEFSHMSSLDAHVEHMHSNESKHVCHVCGKNFSSKSNLTAHKKIHSGERPFECAVCHKRFRQKAHLQKHETTHSSATPHQCTVCDKAFGHVSNLNTHMATHSNSRPHNCPDCGKSYKDAASYKRHRLVHANGSDAGSDVSALGRMKSCPLCPETFADATLVRRHMLLAHPNSEQYAAKEEEECEVDDDEGENKDDTAYSSLENSAVTNPEAGNDESVDDEEKSIEDEMKEDDEGEDDEVENADDSGHKSS